MKYFLKIENGEVCSHPISEENLLLAYPGLNLQALNNKFQEVVLSEPPHIGFYEVYVGVSYEKQNDVYVTIHTKRNMTEEEKNNFIERLKNQWVASGGDPMWVFNEILGEFVPPN